MSITFVKSKEIDKVQGFEQAKFPRTWVKRILVSKTPKAVVDKSREESSPSGLTERLWMGIFYAAPRSGEDIWHSHASYHEVMFYVLQGEGLLEWEEDGKRYSEKVEKGDFFHLPPSLPNRMLNIGKDQLVFLYASHYHDDLKEQNPSVYSDLAAQQVTTFPVKEYFQK